MHMSSLRHACPSWIPPAHRCPPAQALADTAFRVDEALDPALAIDVGASVHGTTQYLVDSGIGGMHPADLAQPDGLEWEAQRLGAKPQPHLARRAQFGEALEHRTDGGDNRGIWVKQYLAVLFAPHESDWQCTAKLAAVPRKTGGCAATATLETTSGRPDASSTTVASENTSRNNRPL